MDELDGAVWRKSSYSGGASGNCVEVAHSPSGRAVGIRDTKNRESIVLVVTPDAWQAFMFIVTQDRA